MNIVCFHNPNEENGYLSNWYLSRFTADGIEFSSMEQYMMYNKAIVFNDINVANQILKTTDVAVIKQFGRTVANYDDNYWNGIRQIVVYDGLIQKFSQNSELKRMLADTGNSILAECAVRDRIWGIGLSMEDADRFDRTKWKGQNLLGYALMQVRNKIIKY
ncbi:MAG: NADAR family protein [Clostridia bacterium]|nr:NADAR family protein [Clostridia bacterium]